MIDIRLTVDPDFFEGPADAAKIFAFRANDTIIGGSGDDFIYGGKGNDSVEGGPGNDTLRGDLDNDTLLGGNGNDQLFGGRGDDRLFGGNGNDTLSGDRGNDTMTGGAGVDTFVISGLEGIDIVTDFNPGEDTLVIQEGRPVDIKPGLGAEVGNTLLFDAVTGTLIGKLLNVTNVPGSSLDLTGRVSAQSTNAAGGINAPTAATLQPPSANNVSWDSFNTIDPTTKVDPYVGWDAVENSFVFALVNGVPKATLVIIPPDRNEQIELRLGLNTFDGQLQALNYGFAASVYEISAPFPNSFQISLVPNGAASTVISLII
ncbi:calcium-binding protein [Trichothermofontia sp.]